MKKKLLLKFNELFKLILLISSTLFIQIGHAQLPQFEWAVKLSGSDWEQGNDIKIDNSGNIYVIGQFKQTVDFDPGPSDFLLTSAGNHDIFVCKLNEQGSFVWAKQIGGIGEDIGKGIQVDSDGNIYLIGNFKDEVDFDPNSGITNLTSAGVSDIFVSKLDASGNLLWVKQFGGIEDDNGFAISLDAHNNVYTTGYFTATSNFTSGNNLTAVGGYDIFINKLTSNGNYSWTKQLGGNGYDLGQSIFVSNGNIYTTGEFQNTADLNPSGNVQNFTAIGFSDVFISKIDTSGNFVWAKQIGGSGNDKVSGISADLIGNIYLNGRFENSVDFDPNAGNFPLTSLGTFDIFIMKLTDSGNLTWVKQIGNNGIEIPFGIMNDSAGNIYTTGTFAGTVDFDPGNGIFNLEFTQSENDCYISQLSNDGEFIWAGMISGSKFTSGTAIISDNSGNIYTTGWFGGLVDVDPSSGTFSLNGIGSRDVFIQKMNSSVGISENVSLNRFTIHPNPTSNFITINSIFTMKEYKIIGILGEVIENKKTNSNIIHVDKLHSGCYLLEILDSNNHKHYKQFIKN